MTNHSSHSNDETAEFIELKDFSFVRLSGADRSSFFHNFCTADIKKLQTGEIAEAMVLNSKGKIIGLVHAMVGAESLLLAGHGKQSQTLIDHLDKFLIRENVTMVDASADLAALFVFGDHATDKIQFGLAETPDHNRSADGSMDGIKLVVWNIEIAGFGYMLVCNSDDLESLKQVLIANGLSAGSKENLNVRRIEKKTPWFGVDADESNLPQELLRDEKAISFNKGCYLGQETVARIDARGRVNQVLVKFTFPNTMHPANGDELTHEGKIVGRITSVGFSKKERSTIGLGYVRRQHADPGSVLDNGVEIG